MRLPIIGITLDYEEANEHPAAPGKPYYAKKPWYALRENYCSAISTFGGIPLPLPHELDLVSHYLEMINGLVITGGAFDVSPELYGQSTQSDTVTTKHRRTRFEYALVQGAIARNIPILGICGGEQLLNVVLGGTLIQHIPDTIANPLAHEQPNPRDEPGHEVAIAAGSLLARIVGSDTIAVNSAHHQAIAKPAPGTMVNATAPDGVIEGIELPSHPFCLGVQWHPEYFVTESDRKVMNAFVTAAAKAA
jgi:putative glutamine amidotransferase